MDTFLVTGGAGFIGSNFINYLNDNYNCNIINIDKLSYGSNLENLKNLKDNYKFIKRDINDDLSDVINDADYIINFAAESHVDRSIANPDSFIKSNINGVVNILENIRKSKNDPVMIQIGTDEEYGDIINGSFDERSVLKPSSPYSASKASSSLIALSYYRTYGIKVIVTRTSNNFGRYQFPEKLIPKTIIRNILDMDIPLYGSGENKRDWIYVEDNIKAILKVLFNGKYGEIYNISSNNEYSNIEIVNKIFDIMNKKGRIKYVSDRPGHDVRYSINADKIKKLGWKPEHSFDDALKMTVEWYLNNRSWWSGLINDDLISEEPWKIKWH
ncbi:dTDP-glucose 4,6-dehydratase [Picrophilus oshimae]|uniref:dTDP-glucose 4,6-dehydratase n=1 Tax=Picrophilus torridus (strain ATCC 700027 / DSM 9790 / JCM 10055 / NBRC 100828 / KAW 2/3) TaxID=1122961 RepID=Q6L2A7_PICTO|nr:dTDP-glucose 4,6-dehydratase [Picrophilus oshimae]AAT42895.1 dTDP-glucose 4,6-dehydratase [Picrophilus oshimae DSM 9789]